MPRILAARRPLSVAGLLLALAGVGLDDRRVVWAAIALLGMAAALRLIASRRSREEAVSRDPPTDGTA